MQTKLKRNESDKIIAGVMAGFADYFKQDVTLWRLGIVLLALLTAVIPVLVFYVIAWYVMPPKDGVDYTVVE